MIGAGLPRAAALATGRGTAARPPRAGAGRGRGGAAAGGGRAAAGARGHRRVRAGAAAAGPRDARVGRRLLGEPHGRRPARLPAGARQSARRGGAVRLPGRAARGALLRRHGAARARRPGAQRAGLRAGDRGRQRAGPGACRRARARALLRVRRARAQRRPAARAGRADLAGAAAARVRRGLAHLGAPGTRASSPTPTSWPGSRAASRRARAATCGGSSTTSPT